MKDKTLISDTDISATLSYIWRNLSFWQLVANLVGACIVTSYFVFFDRAFSVVDMRNNFSVVAVMFPILAAIAFI
jgi:hypothetical protein